MVLQLPEGDAFATGAIHYDYRPVTEAETTNRIILLVEIEGTLDETLQALQTTPENLSQSMLLVVAVKYELGRLSSGAAANLAGIPRTVFLTKLADYGVDTFRLTETELAEG